MSYRVLIRKNSTGEERWREFNLDWSRLWWEEGNASCDCNRHGFFFPDDGEYYPCTESEYSVQLVELDGKQMPMEETPWDDQ